MGGVKNEHYETPVVNVIEMIPDTYFTCTESIRQDDEQGWYEVTI